MKEHLSIKDFAELSNTPASTLRYYDKIGIFKPIIRQDNNYRYYSYEQFGIIYIIEFLSDMGLSIKEISDFMTEKSIEHTLETYRKLSDLLGEKIKRMQEQRIYLYNRISELKQYDENKINEISLVTLMSETLAVSEKLNEENEYAERARFVAEQAKKDINYFIWLGFVYDFEDIHTKKFCFQSRYFVKTNQGEHEKPEGLYIQVYTTYGDVLSGKTYAAITEYAQMNGLKINGSAYGECLVCGIALEREEDSFVKMHIKVEKPKCR